MGRPGRQPKIGPPSLLDRIDEHNAKDGDSFETVDDMFTHFFQGKKLRQEFLEYLRQGYAETDNPLFAWDARSLARKWKLSVPEWVEEYLDWANKQVLHSDNKAADVAGFFNLGGNRSRTQFRSYLTRRAMDKAVDFMNDYIREGIGVEKALGEAVRQIEDLWGIKVKEGEVRKLRLKRNK